MHVFPSLRAALAVLIALMAWPRPSVAETVQVSSRLDGTLPSQGVGYHAQTTGLLTGRLVRNGIVSACDTPRPFPGAIVPSDSFRYDAYTFTAPETRCLTVHLRKLLAGYLQVAAYSSLDPTDLTQGWLADSGNSANGLETDSVAFSMNVTAGQTYTLVVFSVVTGDPDVFYSLAWDAPFTVSGFTGTLDATPPLNYVAFFGERTGQIAGARPNPTGGRSSCGAPRAFPGTTGAGPFRYDAYSFVASVSGCVTLRVSLTTAIGNVQAAAYSAFDPANMTSGWLADAGASTGNNPPSALEFSMNVTAGQIFTLVVFNVLPSQEGAAYSFSVELPAQPPTRFRTVSVVGHTVTFRWTRPVDGPAPTGYVIEGGVNPGEVLASVPLGGNAPIATLFVPTGAYYVRVRSVAGTQLSAVSNEIQLFVNVPGAPSQPADVLAVVEGSTLTLSWRNTFHGRAPTALTLYATGSLSASVPLGLADRATFNGVPPGTYSLVLVATAPGGSSPATSPITVNVPGTCPTRPQPPPGLLAYKTGNTITVLWDPPATGPAPTHYELNVYGSFNGTFVTSARTLSGTAGPGTYGVQVRSVNACGASVYAFAGNIPVP
jgi:hypothetical protein